LAHYLVVAMWVNDLSQYTTNTKMNSAFYPSKVKKLSTGLLAGVRRDAFSCVE